MRTTILTLAIIVHLAGWSSGDESAGNQGEHVWKDQVATIDKAKDAEKAMTDAAAKQAAAVRQQTE